MRGVNAQTQESRLRYCMSMRRWTCLGRIIDSARAVGVCEELRLILVGVLFSLAVSCICLICNEYLKRGYPCHIGDLRRCCLARTRGYARSICTRKKLGQARIYRIVEKHEERSPVLTQLFPRTLVHPAALQITGLCCCIQKLTPSPEKKQREAVAMGTNRVIEYRLVIEMHSNCRHWKLCWNLLPYSEIIV